jgi:carboxyl-terminal processing protease
VGYVALTTFTRNAGKNVGAAVKKLKEDNPNLKGVVFDLRGNGGGLLTEAVDVSNVFIPKNELVVTTRGKVKDWDRSFKTLNKPVDEAIPLVVLIDNGSASASEIVSGVLQDLDRGVLLGQRSYGKGLVQNTRDVGYNSKVKLTTAKYYIPSGRCIQSVKYDNGEPLDIPDAERTPFKTRSGRAVLDGGGVKPDMMVGENEELRVIKSLKSKYLIFQFVNEFVAGMDEMTSIEDYRFDGFDQFIKFLEKRDYSYESESEKMLNKLMMKAQEENFEISDELKNAASKINTVKIKDIARYEDRITSLIEKEIASRFFYEQGKIKMGLRNDVEIKEAIDLLKNQAKYDSLLK